DVSHVVALVHETVAFGTGGDQAEYGFARRGTAAHFHRGFTHAPGPRAQAQLHAIFRLLGDVVDHPANGARAVAQRGGPLQYFDAFHALHAGVVVARVADEETRCH